MRSDLLDGKPCFDCGGDVVLESDGEHCWAYCEVCKDSNIVKMRDIGDHRALCRCLEAWDDKQEMARLESQQTDS